MNLSSEIVSSDQLQIVLYAVSNGIMWAFFIALVFRATWWLWK